MSSVHVHRTLWWLITVQEYNIHQKYIVFRHVWKKYDLKLICLVIKTVKTFHCFMWHLTRRENKPTWIGPKKNSFKFDRLIVWFRQKSWFINSYETQVETISCIFWFNDYVVGIFFSHSTGDLPEYSTNDNIVN